jgi:hypothetical protein
MGRYTIDQTTLHPKNAASVALVAALRVPQQAAGRHVLKEQDVMFTLYTVSDRRASCRMVDILTHPPRVSACYDTACAVHHPIHLTNAR